jgi:hypothetical protein
MMEYCEKSFSELLKEKRNGGLLNESVWNVYLLYYYDF